ncbi:hypothetical protein [Bradyrhizobium sp. BR 1433]|uniref:hypothetical protein n=1 Tax=Bradyrhizobium sp. BR 1433 TaxID=3447967 RepID=UPI003EE65271
MSDKVAEVDLPDRVDVTLEKIDFDHGFYGDDETPHRTYFEFRLHIDEGHFDFPVTMTDPYKDLADLEKQAWSQAYLLLRSFAELIKRRSALPELKFR